MTESRAALIGFSAVAVFASLFQAIYVVGHDMSMDATWLRRPVSDLMLGLGGFFLAFLPFSVAATIVLGVPSFLLCRRFGLVSWRWALAGGVLAGVVVSGLVAQGLNQSFTAMLLRFVPDGAISGLVFWLVWKRCVTSAAGAAAVETPK